MRDMKVSNARVGWCASCVAVTTALVVGCEPAEQGRATSAVVVRVADGFTIEIPSCAGGGVGLFDIFASHGRSDSMRFSKRADSDHDRIVRVEISTETLRSKQFGPEVSLLGTDGKPIQTPDELQDVYLNTDVGFVEFDPSKLPTTADGRTVATGHSLRPATSADIPAALLARACPGA